MIQDPLCAHGIFRGATAHYSLYAPIACQMIEQAVLHQPLPAIQGWDGFLASRWRHSPHQ